MKPDSSYRGLTAACLLLIGSSALQGATVQAFARDGVDVGSSANNAANGGAWGNPDENGPPYFSKPANPVGTVTTALVADDGTGNGTPASFTYRITDTATGVDFTVDMTVTAFHAPSGGSYSPANMRTYSQVDGPGSENRNRTEFATNDGASEYWRTAFDLNSITVNSAHTVTFVGWDQVKFKAIDGSVTGQIVASGGTNAPGTGASLFDFSSANSGGVVSLAGGTGVSSIDWVPTAGTVAEGFQSQGWVASFDVTVIPEPSALALLGLGAAGLFLRRKR